MAAILFGVGALLIAVGVAFVYWPAGIIAAGFVVVVAGVLVDLTTPTRDHRGAERDQ